MTHPSRGLPSLDLTAGSPDAARRIGEGAPRHAAHALAVAVEGSAEFRGRYDELGLRARLRDAELLAKQVAKAVAAGSASVTSKYAEMVVPPYRRMRVPMDDLIALCQGLRTALPDVLAPDEMPAADAALDAAIAVFKWHRRIAGDAKPKNPLVEFLYKGA